MRNDCVKIESDVAWDYLTSHLRGINALSDGILTQLPFQQGEFKAMLPGSPTKRMDQFTMGGIGVRTRKACEEKLLHWIRQRRGLSCVFDAFEDEDDGQPDELYERFGALYDSQVYYILQGNQFTDQQWKECFDRTNIIWHALCVVTRGDVPLPLTEGGLKTIVQEAVIVLFGAYDGEGYLVWEKEGEDL
ncbi:MAG: hypothetical protein S4CHLAM102_05330 [Chlamydiia bacterium]|nr:hypothetical protein [Chlamydiia bacterium]